jgi:hypothetical protein
VFFRVPVPAFYGRKAFSTAPLRTIPLTWAVIPAGEPESRGQDVKGRLLGKGGFSLE